MAALDAAALRDCLRRGGGGGLARGDLRAAAKPIGVAWQMVAGSDLTVPGVADDRSSRCVSPPGLLTGR